MKKRLLSILLLFCMPLTLFPVPAFAEDEALEEAPVCVCTEACTEEAVNYACPVCGAGGAQACTCAEEVIVINAADDAGDVGGADNTDDTNDANDADTAAYSTYAADAPSTEATGTNELYILNFDANGGAGAPAAMNGESNTFTVPDTVPTRDGYDFLGWAAASDAAEAQYQPGGTVTIDEGNEKTVYAVWKFRPLETVVTTLPALPKEAYIGRTFGDGSLSGGEAKVKGTDTVVPGKFIFKNFDDGGVRVAGENRLRVHFIPNDQETYATAECEIIVIGLKHTIAKVRTKIAITDKPLGTPADELGITATSVEVETNVGTLYSPIPVTWDFSTYDPNELGTQTIYGTLDVADSWYAYAINEETDVKATIEVTLIDTRIFETTIAEAPVISKTFYALERYKTLEASLSGGVAMADGKEIEGTFSFDENELLYGEQAWPETSLRYGELTRTVVFTPANTRNYTTATCTVTVNILPLKAIQISSFYDDITDKPVGTEFAGLGLRDKVSFVASENRDDPADKWIHYDDDVIWDESKYDKDSPYEQTITGTLSLRYWKDYILLPDEPLTLSVKVKLKYDPVAPTIVTAPVLRWTKGDYALGDNQIFIGDYLQLGTTSKIGEADETALLIGGEAVLDGTKVSGTFSIKKGTQRWFSTEGQHDVTLVFTPDDTVIYAPAECTIKLNAVKRTVASVYDIPDVTDCEVGTAFEKLGLPWASFLTEDGKIYSAYGIIWDKAAYDPYSIEEQTITGTIKLDGTVKQPEPELKATVKVRLKATENTVEICYHMYNPDGNVEYNPDGTGAILTDHTTKLDDYELRDFGAIFQALQAAGMFTGLSIDGNELDGWYQTRSFADTDRVTNTSQLTVTGKRVDLYGKIIPKTITITLELGGGELPEGVSSTVTRTYGSWYDLPKPTRHGYSFTYWFTAETGGSEIFQATTITQTTDHTVYARWKQIAGHSPVRDQKPEALVKAATCTADAVYYMSCSCGEIIKSETFAAENTALGHDYVKCASNGDGTHTGVCSRDAVTGTEPCSGGFAYCMEKATCAKCNTEYGELGGHIYGADWKCDNTYHWHECSGCKGVDSKVLHADNDKDHRCDACYQLLSTCADNNKDHLCDVCSKQLSECADNNKDHLCDVCGKQLSECADDNKDHLCDTCGKKLTDHTGGTATCTAKAACTVCGKEYGEMAPHSFTAETAEAKYLKTAATCTAKAVYYKSCAVCGAAGTGTFEYGEKDPDNHSGKSEWTVTASTHEQKWSCCGKVTVSSEGHSFGEWVVTKSPTYSQRGIRMHTCQLCGYYESEYIPATGGGKTPQTGDDSALGLWSLLMCASLTGALSLTALGFRQRTKKKQ